MGKHIVCIGAGAVGGFIGGHLTLAGEDVVLVDPWAEHVEYIKKNGLHLLGKEGEQKVVRADAIHLYEVQRFIRKPVDIAMLCMKSYDTEWATMMIKQYLAPHGYVVSMQNGINEERIAKIVGWGKTMGCVLSTIGVSCPSPGHIVRYRAPRGAKSVFRVGEVHGRATARVRELVATLNTEPFMRALRQEGAAHCAEVTSNLWGERWTKLTTNAMTHGLLGATGLSDRDIFTGRGAPHRIGIMLAAESVAVGRAQGYELGTMMGMVPDDWVAAGTGNPAALRKVQEGLTEWAGHTEPSTTSVSRDVEKGRRSEAEFTNGLVAEKGVEFGVPAPTHAAIAELMRRIDRGELTPSPSNVERLAAEIAS